MGPFDAYTHGVLVFAWACNLLMVAIFVPCDLKRAYADYPRFDPKTRRHY